MADPVPAGSDVSSGTYKCTICGYEGMPASRGCCTGLGSRGAPIAWALGLAADDRAGLLATGCPERYAPGARCVPGPKEALAWFTLESTCIASAHTSPS
jgi:hypothetical protein